MHINELPPLYPTAWGKHLVYILAVSCRPLGLHRQSPGGGQSASWPGLETALAVHYIAEGGREGGREELKASLPLKYKYTVHVCT